MFLSKEWPVSVLLEAPKSCPCHSINRQSGP
jgi:hypothetical protein